MIRDSDILIDLLRHHPSAWAWFTALPSPPNVSGMAALEITYGSRNAAELHAVQTFLSPLPLVWPTEDDLRRALVDHAPLRLSHGLSVVDALIAATATRRGEELATFNVKHFGIVPGLTTVQPYTL